MESRGAAPPAATPLSVSIVIPAFNSAAHVERLLASLCAQTYPRGRYEIIVVDDGSSDATAALAERALAQWEGGAGRVLRKTNGGPASARNAGIRASTADVIAFIDADCVADPDWLEKVVGALESGAAGAGGPLRNVAPPGWVSDYLSACDFFRQRARNGVVDYLLTANVAFRRAALTEVGGFAERPGVWTEDADLSFRLKQEGYALLLASGGAVTHFGSPGSVKALGRELYRYGFGSAVLSRNWRNGRSPAIEFIRHGGAALLAPLLALRLRNRVGLARAMSFWPLITLEHLSFCWGLCMGVMRGSAEKGA
ncbi:MAG TPA: glycosyltransferase [Ktedonobacterales bacterium]|nr:glycosyltransferase [Ktedonobacterales bacterium]